jgi:hypothetical protein
MERTDENKEESSPPQPSSGGANTLNIECSGGAKILFPELSGLTIKNIYIGNIGYLQSHTKYDDGNYLLIDYVDRDGIVSTVSFLPCPFGKLYTFDQRETLDKFYPYLSDSDSDSEDD